MEETASHDVHYQTSSDKTKGAHAKGAWGGSLNWLGCVLTVAMENWSAQVFHVLSLLPHT